MNPPNAIRGSEDLPVVGNNNLRTAMWAAVKYRFHKQFKDGGPYRCGGSGGSSGSGGSGGSGGSSSSDSSGSSGSGGSRLGFRVRFRV